MKKSEIIVGGKYKAKVSGKLTTVRVDAIRKTESYRAHQPHTPTTRYDVTNLATGRKLTFRSAAKFRSHLDGTKFLFSNPDGTMPTPVTVGLLDDTVEAMNRAKAKTQPTYNSLSNALGGLG